MKVYLIGMPGSGKSTLGRRVAKNLNLTFIDLDEEIRKDTSMDIPEIFESEGEDRFREIEGRLLRELSMSLDSFIMSTGGGAPCHHENMSLMNKIGITVYLKISTPELLKRLEPNKDDRPLLAKSDSLKEIIEELLSVRNQFYAQANITLDSDALSPADIRNALLKN